MLKSLAQDDLNINWHPCSQMKDYEEFPPLSVKKAYGSYIELTDGKKIIDAVSSWWCKSLGHNHPILKKALIDQINQFEHVIFANTTNKVIVDLSKKLLSLFSWLKKAFYAGDGSCAVEIALKMSLHARVNQRDSTRNQFIALRHGYHGETIGALSLSDLGIYRTPYSSLLFKPHFINVPYVSNRGDLLWNDAARAWNKTEKLLEPLRHATTALILEPILQGAGGMKIYSQDFLSKLFNWAKKNNIHVIADEIMTGIGRTGKMLACEHAGIRPDFVCLSKGLTSGWLPFSAVLTTDEIYNIFYDNYKSDKAFLHSHTYSGNALGASVALATLNFVIDNNLCRRAEVLEQKMFYHMSKISEKTGKIHNIRAIGAMVAGDLKAESNQKRLGYQVYKQSVRRGALLRPLGNTIYWLPPLTISDTILEDLSEITLHSVNSL